MLVDGKQIITLRHPTYLHNADNWKKWRTVYAGGDSFIETYTEKFSDRESNTDFKIRKKITPAPSFAKAVVNDIKNSIFQRMADVTRKGGPDSYQKAVQGQGLGVDLHGTSMNTFIGREVLPELLTMAKVGIFVDFPPVEGGTLRDSKSKTPYLYVYKAEEILSWSWRKDKIDEYQAVLLTDYVDDCEEFSGLPQGQWTRHRLCWVQDNVVLCIMFDEDGVQIDLNGEPTTEPFIIDLPYIPFITMDLTDSLLADVANHQIALLNMESADISYSLKSNFPFYIEQVDDRDYSQYLKGPAAAGNEGVANEVGLGGDREIRVGQTQGRRYRKDLDAPGFIHPSPEPLKVSMEKQAKLKDDIRQLVNLALSNIKPKMASAESKAIDERGLESGLSYIGLELERGERRLAKIWADYEASKDIPLVNYPQKWSLQTDEDRRKDVEQLEDLRDTLPSPSFQKEVSKLMAQTLLGAKITTDELAKIFKEIDNAESITADPETIFEAVERGVLDLERAATLLGFPKDAPKDAAKDHAARLARISEAQAKKAGPANAAAARGVGDLSDNPGREGEQEKAESRDTTTDDVVSEKVRGEGQ